MARKPAVAVVFDLVGLHSISQSQMYVGWTAIRNLRSDSDRACRILIDCPHEASLDFRDVLDGQARLRRYFSEPADRRAADSLRARRQGPSRLIAARLP